MSWTLAFLYTLGALNGVLTVAVDHEAHGDWVPLYKMVLATILWPALVPACLAVVVVRRIAR